jgi:hypothetical protein
MEGEIQVEELIPRRPGQGPILLDHVAPTSGLSVRDLRGAFLVADEVGPNFVVVSEDDDYPDVGFIRDFERPEGEQPWMVVSITLTADSRYSVDQILDGLLFGLRYERPVPPVIHPVPAAPLLGESARAVRVAVELDGEPVVLNFVVWQQEPVLAYAIGIIKLPGDEALFSSDLQVIVERQYSKLDGFLSDRE